MPFQHPGMFALSSPLFVPSPHIFSSLQNRLFVQILHITSLKPNTPETLALIKINKRQVKTNRTLMANAFKKIPQVSVKLRYITEKAKFPLKKNYTQLEAKSLNLVLTRVKHG